MKAISRLINSARYNRLQLLSLINKTVDHINRPIIYLKVEKRIDDYAKDGGPEEVRLLYSFYHESLRTWIKTIVNKFAISNHTALMLDVYALRSYLKLICEYELHSLPSKKAGGARDHGKNYIKV